MLFQNQQDKAIAEESKPTRILGKYIGDEIKPSVKKLYKIIQRHTGKVGGYGHNCSIYGEVTIGSFQRMVNFLKENLDFDGESIFLDIGSGLGKPNFHVLLDPGVRYSFGVELEALRYSLSLHNLNHLDEVPALSFLKKRPNVYFAHKDVTEIETFNPITHVYTFDVGMPPDTMLGISKALENSISVKAFVSFHKPKEIIEDYEFPVELVGTFHTTMHGSSEGHKGYIFCHKVHKNLSRIPRHVSEFHDSMLRNHDGDVETVLRKMSKLKLDGKKPRGLRPRRSTRNIISHNSDSDHKQNLVSKKKRPLRRTVSNLEEGILNMEIASSGHNDPVFDEGFRILAKKGYFSKYIKNQLAVYFPEERPKRVCNLKSIR